MAYAITNTMKGRSSQAPPARGTFADTTLTSAQTSTLASIDLGANLYTRGLYQFRIKTITGAGSMVLFIAADTAVGFATAKTFVGSFQTVTGTTEAHFAGLWERQGTAEFFRLEAVVTGVPVYTIDGEVTGIP